jgi:hypothetical protein
VWACHHYAARHAQGKFADRMPTREKQCAAVAAKVLQIHARQRRKVLPAKHFIL